MRTSDQETYTLDEVRAVLSLNANQDPVWIAFVIAVFSGLRAFELRALRWDAIDWRIRMLRVARGKCGKVRSVPFMTNSMSFFVRLVAQMHHGHAWAT